MLISFLYLNEDYCQELGDISILILKATESQPDCDDFGFFPDREWKHPRLQRKPTDDGDE
jgi:hypothetical protein